MLTEEAAILVQGFIECPEEDIVHQIHRIAASVGWRSLFGHKSIPLLGPDPTHRIEELGLEMTVAVLPGGSMVDIFPLLKPVIARVAYLRRRADLWYEEISGCFERAYSANQVEGQPSVSGVLKKTGEKLGLDRHAGSWVVGGLFFAAEDTMACALLWFVYAMLLYPETASAAREQLREVLGDRRPAFSDRDKLPQVEAMVKEVLRWRPPAPLSVAHAASEDFEYIGYTIPRGAIVVANVFEIARDPLLYADGDSFDPSRFIDDNGQLKQSSRDSKDDYLCFGHGRRICVGKDLAINALWISVAYLLWAFDFKRARDRHGVEANHSASGFRDKGATIEPPDFSVQVMPRYPDLVERLKIPSSSE
ncbi:cytochrome P450 [Calocera viscosa TUFC12733]|uniref:Cytochrome P450 n=1 Tax=Calocera viscosa (strain TUFC12733) TaxID=1330018 RepID=A0A167RNI4_CALVF|nr:cytochrome P450 [Calocera viscosa TUFC12733]